MEPGDVNRDLFPPAGSSRVVSQDKLQLRASRPATEATESVAATGDDDDVHKGFHGFVLSCKVNY